MKYLRQLAILFAFCVLGDVISTLLGGAMPGNVLGMTLLFVCLAARVVKPRQIDDTADFFLGNMAFFFLPACLGILNVYGEIRSELLPILAVILLTTLLTAAATAITVHLVLRMQKLRRLRARQRQKEGRA